MVQQKPSFEEKTRFLLGVTHCNAGQDAPPTVGCVGSIYVVDSSHSFPDVSCYPVLFNYVHIHCDAKAWTLWYQKMTCFNR